MQDRVAFILLKQSFNSGVMIFVSPMKGKASQAIVPDHYYLFVGHYKCVEIFTGDE